MKKVEVLIVMLVLTAAAFVLSGCQESQAPKVWGNGELPADYQEMFGNRNPDRLNYAQNDLINKHEVLLRGLNGKDKAGNPIHQNGVIDIVLNLQSRIERIEVAKNQQLKTEVLEGKVADLEKGMITVLESHQDLLSRLSVNIVDPNEVNK